ncbi:glycosyl transferase, partial [Thermoascus aurantiacus ATCC 26904]
VKESPDVVSKPEPVNDDRPRAAMISLVRNSDLDLVLRSMRQLETRWNARYRYPWVFFSDEPLSREFKDATSNATFAACYYEVVPQEHWSVPDWIDGDMFNRSLEYLKQIGVHNKGSMDDASYRHLKARWHSGFFYKHPRMQEFDWYWRVKPDAQFYGNIDYDVFRFMRDNGMKYGYGSSMDKILGYNARSAPSLLWRTRSFMDVHPELIHPEADLDWLLLDREPQSSDNNKRQFSANVEIGDLHFFRGEQHGRYFEWLDRSGGFFYEFPGDAAVRALSAAMFLPKRQVWFLGDVGCQYRVDGYVH